MAKKTFLQIKDEVINDSNLSWKQKIVYSHIIRRSMSFGYCKEGLLTMSDALDMRYSTVRHSISHLIKNGYVKTNGLRGNKWNCRAIDVYKSDIDEAEQPAKMTVVKDISKANI